MPNHLSHQCKGVFVVVVDSLKSYITDAYLLLIELLEKNRHKRPTLEEALNHPWFAEFKEIHAMRQGAKDGEARFMAYSLTEPNSPKIREEIERYTK
jgi:hypothetical protein